MENSDPIVKRIEVHSKEEWLREIIGCQQFAPFTRAEILALTNGQKVRDFQLPESLPLHDDYLKAEVTKRAAEGQ